MSEIEISRTESPDWLSNSYLVVNPQTQAGVLIDGNGVGQPLLDTIDRRRIRITAILLTHHHVDHVVIDDYQRFDVPVLAHPDTAALAALDRPVRGLSDGEVVESAGLRIEALYTPGHARDHIAFIIDRDNCFTGDVIFRGTVGGTRGPGGSDLPTLRRSIDRLLALPGDTVLYPGHCEDSTVAEELANNPFVVAWRSGQGVGAEPCKVRGEPAQLLLWGPDYDGTHKAWVRMPDGQEHVIGGSQVKRSS